MSHKRDILYKIAKAIEFCHSKGVLHKDIKPENIMVKKDRTIRLIDFGFSEIISNNNSQSFSFCGTPYFVPPEFLKKQPSKSK